jgi:glycosyltransferase involved in cell wall biosynthesis
MSSSAASEPLRILVAACVPRRREGGVAATIYNLSKQLEARGHSISYLFLQDLVDPNSGGQRFHETIFAVRLAKHIAKNRAKYSVVNLHGPSGFVYGWRRALPGGEDLPPYVLTLHGLEERRVRVMKREAEKGRAWNFSFKNRVWHRIYHQPRYTWSINSCDGAHVHCRDVWTVLQLKYNLEPHHVAYIPHGVEQRFFVKREYRDSCSPKLLYPGTWLDQRGIFYIRDALKGLVQKLPNLKLTVAGPGAPESVVNDFFGPDLRSFIDVRPTIQAESMPALYAEHDALLFPSLMEGLPCVLMEAMASGMPVIATETCGMADVVENNFNGLLVPPADAPAIEEAVLRVASSRDLRQRLGEAAQHSMARYTWEDSAIHLEQLFRYAIHEGK